MRTGTAIAAAVGITMAWGLNFLCEGSASSEAWLTGRGPVDAYEGVTRQFMVDIQPIASNIYDFGIDLGAGTAIIGAWILVVVATLGHTRWLGLAMFHVAIFPLLPWWLAAMPLVARLLTPTRYLSILG